MGMKSGGGDGELNSEINVTPFVDVMLVLLIIFMITAPMMNTGVALDLPAVTAQNIEDPSAALVLSISKDNKIFLGTTQISWKDLKVKLETNAVVQKAGQLFVQADTALPYGIVIAAMAIAHDAKVAKVMMLTNPTDVLDLTALDSGKPVAIPPSPPQLPAP